jgi:hypothetical protein
VQRSVLEYQRKVLLTTSSTYGTLAAAALTVFFAHRHLTVDLGAASALPATGMFLAVLRTRGLGHHRARLATGLLLTGPLSPVLLARRTRHWRPILLLRPRPSRR